MRPFGNRNCGILKMQNEKAMTASMIVSMSDERGVDQSSKAVIGISIVRFRRESRDHSNAMMPTRNWGA